MASPDLAVAPAAPGVLGRLLRRPLALFGLVIIAIIVIAAVLAPWSRPSRPNEQFFDGLTLEGAPLPPNAQFCSAPTCSAATCSRACSTARRPRCVIGIVANGIAVLIGTAGRHHRRLFPRPRRRACSCASPT